MSLRFRANRDASVSRRHLSFIRRLHPADFLVASASEVWSAPHPYVMPMRVFPFALLLLAGCASTTSLRPAPDPEAVIYSAFEASADAWNRGDIDGHVAMYADSTAFMTGQGPQIGRQRTADTLERAFFRDGQPVQQLRFESLAVRRLGPAHALVTGRFILSGGGMDDRTGWFTTVWAYSEAGWQIIHDHSS